MSYKTQTFFICIMAEALNFIVAYIFFDMLHVPLFLDTIFTIAVTFYCGLFPGLMVGFFYNVLSTLTLTVRGFDFEPYTMLFGICGVLTAIVTWFFARRKDEFKISMAVTVLYLVLIAVISSFVSSIAGGTIDFIRYTLVDLPARLAPIKDFTYSFQKMNFSLLASCYLAQIPVSVIDRLITTFLGFGVYKIMVRFFGEERWG